MSEPRSRPRLRRRWFLAVAAFVVVVSVVLGLRDLDRPAPLFGYKILDDHNIAVQTVSGPSAWTRLDSLTETTVSVTVGVTSWTAPLLAGSGDDISWIAVRLRDPIGTRTVVDASSGQPLALLK